jgi:glc operon protein GlcG
VSRNLARERENRDEWHRGERATPPRARLRRGVAMKVSAIAGRNSGSGSASQGTEHTMTTLIRRLGCTAALLTAPVAVHAQESLTVHKEALSLAAAKQIVAAAEIEATRRGLGVVIVVVDDAGHIVLMSRMDTAQVASVNVGIGKARTAAIYRRPSRVFEEQITNGRVAALALADATPQQGGVPVIINGAVVGAVGVSGDSPKADEEIAMAGARAIEAQPEADERVWAVTFIHGIPGKADPLKAHLLSLAEPTRAEAGAIAYDLFESPERPHEFMRFEIWKSAEALEQHKQTPPLRESFARRQREGWTTEILTWRPVPDGGAR